MRLLLAAALSCSVLAGSTAAEEPTFPYKAFITADAVYVRSGPGQTYYPTDKLKAGQEVEVYRHDPGGWYAIKPPEGSFTWVSGRYLRPGVDNLAVVTDDRIAARVGSRFSDIRDVIQVRLHKAEVVEVLEAKKSADRSTTWYKIAPPSGEFRWVFGKYVDPDYPHEGTRKTQDAAHPVDEPDATTAVPNTPSTPAAHVEPVETAAPDPVTRPQQPPQPTSEAPSTITIPEPGGGETAWQPTEVQEPTYAPDTPRGISPEQYRAELEEIDLELSGMVVEEPTVWTFYELRQHAETLLDQAETAVERGRARVLLKKMARFEDIKRRYDAINLARAQTERLNRRLAGLSQADRSAGRELDLESRFDGVGQLTRVVSPKLGAPRYALVDRLGGLRCYVSPAPGLPLHHYVGQRVGVSGTRGYMPEQHAPHVMARHVSPLDRRIR